MVDLDSANRLAITFRMLDAGMSVKLSSLITLLLLVAAVVAVVVVSVVAAVTGVELLLCAASCAICWAVESNRDSCRYQNQTLFARPTGVGELIAAQI